ncbi:unnamed protein product [Durusdinium trenchii]|uniref:Uncharacterized protein n=2 Tax=Durusdinium trenchii TaxID=1381693 RepID=A0ABP0KRG8_9DINO
MSSGRLLVAESKQVRPPWWRCALLWVASGFAWVVSIPLLLFTLGGSMQPHMGWATGIGAACGMFSILVQVDQRLAAFAVFLASSAEVSFSSALAAQQLMTFVLAAVATCLTTLNAKRRVCNPSEQFLDFQYGHYSGYHKRSELNGALEDIHPSRSFFACHPHGVLSIGWISNVCWGRKFHQVAGRCFCLIDPTLRNKGLLAKFFLDAYEGPHGGFRDTRSHTMQELMERGSSVAMIPGAYQEATAFTYGRERVALARRKGFVKYCLQYGYRLHPVYTFGESETYYTACGFEWFRLWLNRKGIPTVAFRGLPWCPLLPRSDVEMLTFVGPALELPQISHPSPQEVDEWHARYIDALVALFDKHKAEAGKPAAVLEIV